MRTLRPYQQTGVDWLMQHPRGGLFDDQGLGKTIQTIIAADKLGVRSILIVAPTVAADNWRKEIQHWSPKRRVFLLLKSSQQIPPGYDVVVVTHGLVFDPEVNRQLRNFELTIVDETQFMRNPTAKRTKAVYLGKDALVRRSPRAWPLTGTPTPNNPSELWTMIAGIDPERLRDKETGKLLTYTQFRDRFCVVVPSGFGNGVKIVGVQRAPELRERLKGFGLRRLKKDVLKDLPPMRFSTVAVTADVSAVRAAMVDSPVLHDAGLVDDEDLLAEMKRDSSFARWRKLCGLAKVDPAVDLVKGDLEGGMEKVILVAHHREVIHGLVEGLTDYGATAITGDVGALQRGQIVEAFQNDPDVRVIVLNIIAGGTAINLQAASDVVFVEMSPVPGENAQVMDRAHRFGQTKSVLTRFLYLPDSVDELFAEILARKTEMIREVQL